MESYESFDRFISVFANGPQWFTVPNFRFQGCTNFTLMFQKGREEARNATCEVFDSLFVGFNESRKMCGIVGPVRHFRLNVD